RQQTSRAFMLRLRFKSGRNPVAIAWAMFNDAEIEEMEEGQRLTILFAHRVVHITGQRLDALLVEIESERVDERRELDSKEAELADAEQAPVITHIEVLPDLKARVAEVLNRTEKTYGPEELGYPEGR